MAVAVVLGFFITAQGRSFDDVNAILRDGANNIFQELMIMKDKNVALRMEIEGLEHTLEQLADRNSAISVIEEEIVKYKQLSGADPVFGPGAVISVDGNLSTPWVIDIINELFSVGAQAVSINGIRITNLSVGFDTLPQGQILINGSILKPPYVFYAIGDGTKLLEILELPGGIFDRMEATFPKIKIATSLKNVIRID